MKKLALLLIRFYQICLSPFVGGSCKFYPTCSAYTKEAIEKKGVWKGSLLGIKRILKCGPWHRGGYDPVISQESSTSAPSEES